MTSRARRRVRVTNRDVWNAFAGRTLRQPTGEDLIRERKRRTERVIATLKKRPQQLSLFERGSGVREEN